MNKDRTVPGTDIEFIIRKYDVLLFDAFGVLMHRGGPYPGVPAMVQRLKKTGKTFYVLTNGASKLPRSYSVHLRQIGLMIDPAQIITSGSLLNTYFQSEALIGRRCIVLGPDDSREYVRLAGGIPSGFADKDADVIVLCDERGYPFLKTVDMVLNHIAHLMEKGIRPRLILTNPDIIYARDEKSIGITAGGIAVMMEAALQQYRSWHERVLFERIGKPGPMMFEEAFRRCGKKKMVMLGDQMETDIKGASDFGIDSVLVDYNSQRPPLPEAGPLPRPTYILRSFQQRRGTK
jgi:HAD superfamily hydrolase (TIGR01450 family)